MPSKAKATKTVNPLHFEDLDPHRFEDLVRRLLYGFRDWKNLEATGRSGDDGGFDIRAWEKTDAITNVSADGEEGARSTEGRMWQVQCKRTKTLAPKEMKAVLKHDLDETNLPHGYILATPSVASKATFDVFRSELRKRGVIEFALWDRSYLEDQLFLPHNDDILFTFFGLSISPRRRSRITEIKFGLNNKNKMQKLVFGSGDLNPHQPVPKHKCFLLRDIKADEYPYQSAYPDFAERRRWEEHDVEAIWPTGVLFKDREWYALLDPDRKEWDFSKAVDLTGRKHNLDAANQARLEDTGKDAERFWRYHERARQAKLYVCGFVPFEDMLIIDDHGDTEYTDPHIFIDFGSEGPFRHTYAYLTQRGVTLQGRDIDELKRVRQFPSSFAPRPQPNAVHGGPNLDPQVVSQLQGVYKSGSFHNFSDEAFKVGDIIHLADSRGGEKDFEITHVSQMSVAEILQSHFGFSYRTRLNEIAGREVTDDDVVSVYEVHKVFLGSDGKTCYYEESD